LKEYIRQRSQWNEVDRQEIYRIFENYEKWKRDNNMYDLMDFVNHLIIQTNMYGYKGPDIHFLMIDEVQDLTPATHYLLIKNIKQNVMLFGDTAQTISQGIGFKFRDLRKVFKEAN
jgi:superfamily I DNA/RNA helicase